MEHPYYGVERMTDYLNLDLGHRVDVKRIRRLYKIMGLQTVYRKPRTTIKDPESYKYPYLLKDLKIERPGQVWRTDITYIPMLRGFMYMNAIIDVYSRKILNWGISNSMDKQYASNYWWIPSPNMAHRKYITPIRDPNIRAPSISKCSRNMRSKYRWTAREGRWTTSISNASGSPSNTKRYTLTLPTEALTYITW